MPDQRQSSRLSIGSAAAAPYSSRHRGIHSPSNSDASPGRSAKREKPFANHIGRCVSSRSWAETVVSAVRLVAIALREARSDATTRRCEEPPLAGGVAPVHDEAHEEAMTSVRGKKSRSTRRSGSNRAKAKARKPRSTTMALVSPTKHVKTQSRKPHRGQSAQPRNEQMPTGGGAGGRANSAPTRKRKRAATPLTAAMDRNTDLRSARSDPARIMVFWSPMAIVVRNQRMFSSIMLNVIQAQCFQEENNNGKSRKNPRKEPGKIKKARTNGTQNRRARRPARQPEHNAAAIRRATAAAIATYHSSMPASRWPVPKSPTTQTPTNAANTTKIRRALTAIGG